MSHISWDDNGEPISTQFDDRYYSHENGLSESEYVFIDKNQLHQRWTSLHANENTRSHFIIGETGFGTGLNFLLAVRLWLDVAPQNATLHFISTEKYPLRAHEIEQAGQRWPELSGLIQKLKDAYPAIANYEVGRDTPRFRRMSLHAGRVELTLILGDAAKGFDALRSTSALGPNLHHQEWPFGNQQWYMDAWFLDGFAPAKNPDMWTPELYRNIARLSRPDTTFATFTAAGNVRRGLNEVGFSPKKYPGYGKKREMLAGVYNSPPEALNPPQRKPDATWHIGQAANPPHHQTVLIIGGGLAGCHTANALAKKGISVTLCEKHQLASGASGNAQGIVYSKLSHDQDIFAQFNVTAMLFANRFYQCEKLFDRCGQQCGVLQLETKPQHHTLFNEIAAQYSLNDTFVSTVDKRAASRLAGLTLDNGGIFHHQSGWLSPPNTCKTLVQHPNIRVLENTHIHELIHDGALWHAQGTQNQHTKYSEYADYVVIAGASDSLALAQTAYLPLKPIRGQTTLVQSTEKTAALECVICTEGYIAPAVDSQHCIGATFTLHSQSHDISLDDHQKNIDMTHAMSDALTSMNEEHITGGRVSFRCTTPDYLPIVGPVAVDTTMIERFAKYRQNSKAVVDAPGEYYPNLFVNTGHGSKGLVYTPLCAQIIADLIDNKPLPIDRELYKHLHPARFLVRDLARRRI